MAFEISGGAGGGGGGDGGVANRIRRRDQTRYAFQPGEKPHSLDDERAILAGILISNDVLNDLEPVLQPDNFFLPAHREIFEAMRALGFKNIPIDLNTLASYLREHGKLDLVGGISYLGQIALVPATSGHAIDYARTVADLAWRRRILSVADFCNEAGLRAGDTRDIATEIEKAIFDATQERKTVQVAKIGDLLSKAMDEYEKRADSKGDSEDLVKTGLSDLDDTLVGFRPGQLIVIAARPGGGKTSIAANIMVHAAARQGKNVLFFSLEMTREEVIERIIAQEAGVDSSKLRRGQLNRQDFENLYYAADSLQNVPIYVDDRSIITPYDVLSQARKISAQIAMQTPGRKIDLIVVDYIQIMKAGGVAESRSIEVGMITGGLKVIAKDLRVPVIALSQLNRESVRRQDKPQLSDLKDSGSIEQDADVVMFIHKENSPDQDSRMPTEAEMIVAKNRAGPTKGVKLTWLGHLTKFTNYAAGARSATEPDYGAPPTEDGSYFPQP